MFYFWDWTMLLLIPGLIISAIAQAKIKSAYSRYNEVPTANGVTGAQAAREIMQDAGLYGVDIVTIGTPAGMMPSAAERFARASRSAVQPSLYIAE